MSLRRPACVLPVLGVLLAGAPAAAFPTEDDLTPGALALAYGKKGAVWARLDAGVEDGRVLTSPPGTTRYDRRLESEALTGFDAPLGARFAVRFSMSAAVVRRRESDQSPPRATLDETSATYRPAVDLTFVTEKGLEIFAGLADQIQPTATQTVTTDVGTSRSTFHGTSVQAPRFGVVRRAGSWSGGFYYVLGAQTSQRVDQTAFDGSGTSTEATAFVPSQAGLMGEFNAASAVWDFELAFVQARGLGSTDPGGNTTLDDYVVAHGAAAFDLGGGLAGLVKVAYQTQSYARSAFVTLDTVPVESLGLVLRGGSPSDHLELGILGAYGRDEQSLPEFNAKYLLVAYAVTAGFRLSL